jgi:hypothetical protein
MTRKVKKEMQRLLYEGVSFDKKGEVSGFSLLNKATADDYMVREMLVSLTIDGVEHKGPVSAAVLDELPADDFDLIVVACNPPEEIQSINDPKAPSVS